MSATPDPFARPRTANLSAWLIAGACLAGCASPVDPRWERANTSSATTATDQRACEEQARNAVKGEGVVGDALDRGLRVDRCMTGKGYREVSPRR